MTRQASQDDAEGRLAIQVRLDQLASFPKEAFAEACAKVVASGWASGLSISEEGSETEGRWLNASFSASDPAALWASAERHALC